jgi:hypothetical protein
MLEAQDHWVHKELQVLLELPEQRVSAGLQVQQDLREEPAPWVTLEFKDQMVYPALQDLLEQLVHLVHLVRLLMEQLVQLFRAFLV